MAFEMIGMKLDQPGNEEIALEILRRCGCHLTVQNLEDAPVPDDDRAFEHLIGQHDAGMGEDRLAHAAASAVEVVNGK